MLYAYLNTLQILVDFTGNPSSQEIDGDYGAVSCEEVFSSDSASFLGVGSTCQFVSDTSLKVRTLSDHNDQKYHFVSSGVPRHGGLYYPPMRSSVCAA